MSADRQFEAADVNGDGKSDFIELLPALFGAGTRHIWLSTGTGFVSGATDGGISWSQPDAEGAGSRFLIMDVNDDDKADMVELYPAFGTYTRRTWLSTGYGYKLGATDTSMSYSTASKQLVMDVNGDHRMDMVTLSPGFLGASTKRDIWLSTGTGFAPGASDPTMGTYTCSKGNCTADFLEMDVNGDMRTEMVELYNTNFGLNKGRHIWNMGGAATDVLTSRTNEWGAKTTVSYKPSSAWANTNNPPLTQTVAAVTDDSRPGRRRDHELQLLGRDLLPPGAHVPRVPHAAGDQALQRGRDGVPVHRHDLPAGPRRDRPSRSASRTTKVMARC